MFGTELDARFSHLTWEQPALEGKMENAKEVTPVTDGMIDAYLKGIGWAGGYNNAAAKTEVRKGLQAVFAMPEMENLPGLVSIRKYQDLQGQLVELALRKSAKEIPGERELALLRLIADQASSLMKAASVMSVVIPALQEIQKRDMHPSNQIADHAIRKIGPMAAF